jgi:hypothetical protein
MWQTAAAVLQPAAASCLLVLKQTLFLRPITSPCPCATYSYMTIPFPGGCLERSTIAGGMKCDPRPLKTWNGSIGRRRWTIYTSKDSEAVCLSSLSDSTGG